tara:strand:+ start:825 stop:1103 length:279 start_codon:yes stop_codon:yes gene_type:complete
MKQTFTLYICVGVAGYQAGHVSVLDFDRSTVSNEYQLLSAVDVEIDVPEYDIVQMELDGIDTQIARIRADAQVKVNNLTQRKQELLAIGHDE